MNSVHSVGFVFIAFRTKTDEDANVQTEPCYFSAFLLFFSCVCVRGCVSYFGALMLFPSHSVFSAGRRMLRSHAPARRYPSLSRVSRRLILQPFCFDIFLEPKFFWIRFRFFFFRPSFNSPNFFFLFHVSKFFHRGCATVCHRPQRHGRPMRAAQQHHVPQGPTVQIRRH